MFASSSHVLARSTLSLSASRSFSTTPTCAAKREAFVELLQDVPGLGRTFDRLFVAPGRARNDLVPTRKARFIAFKDNSKRQVYRATDADRAILNDLLLEAPSDKPFEQKSPYVEPESTPQDLLNHLHVIPSTLTFPRKAISAEYDTIHGSLTVSDIQDKLARAVEEGGFDLPSSEVEVIWVGREEGARIKELGQYEAEIKLRKYGKESVAVTIEVVRE
ncbi:hypothetical protein I316_06556 [Kwoniella heveanensis BCC8398]|uniref:50S ribosomal protein L9, chloroplastic n=1 Tax=Kwoniella heveanensis BCC8398 TaxID=1296120 RepID=A0A1B9GL03_9TREE|nr:hypothetical protein I316_06556 [Kwoniella heveanensis BCC8398]